MGINQKKNKSKKPDKAERERKQFDRELRDCMHCKFFWGNNHRCVINKCCKANQKIVKEKKFLKSALDVRTSSQTTIAFLV